MVDAVNVEGDGQAGRQQLGNSLVAAALAELATTPASELSVRRISERLGVSHQAPYVHFGDRRTFLAAVAGAGLGAAAERAREAVDRVGADPRARLDALAGAYVEFVQSEPHLHDLAYGSMVAMRDHPSLQAAAIEYWNLLVEVVAGCQPPSVSAAEVLNRSAEVWGLVYGVARLDIHRKLPRSVPDGPDSLIQGALEALLRGWRTQR